MRNHGEAGAEGQTRVACAPWAVRAEGVRRGARVAFTSGRLPVFLAFSLLFAAGCMPGADEPAAADGYPVTDSGPDANGPVADGPPAPDTIPAVGGERPRPAPPDQPMNAAGGDTVSLLIRGRITPDSVSLDPLLRLPGPGPAERHEGPHRVHGYAADGTRLFEASFESAAVADLPRPEEHFSVRLPVTEGVADRLHRVEVRLADDRTTARTARLTAAELREALRAGLAVEARRISDRQVRLTWDQARFPELMVASSSDGQVLSFARGGEAIVSTEEGTLLVTISEGVRSATGRVEVR